MSASTTRLSLTKPGGGSTGLITPPDIVDIDVLNANFDKIDASIGAQVVTSTTLPSVPFGGQFVFETDTKRMRVFSGGQFVAPATERGSLTMYSGTGLSQLDAITDAVYGDTFYMTDPGLGNAGTGTIDPMTWEAFADSGVNMNWRIRDQIVADTKAHLDTFIAAVAAIGGTDEQFRVGNRALVSTTRQAYIFRSVAGAYLIDATPLRMTTLLGTTGVTVDPQSGIITSSQQATLGIGTVAQPAFLDPFTDYNVTYDLVGNAAATTLVLQFLDAAGAPIATTLNDVYRNSFINSVTTNTPLMTQANIPLSGGAGGASARHRGRFSIRGARDASAKLFETHEEFTAVPGTAATGGQINLDGVVNSNALLTGFQFVAGAGTFAINELFIEAVPK